MEAMKKLHEVPKQRDRHIVTWTPQEDDLLREQIRINGTESWTAIASKFKDKTSRQCRRRWYTYLNSDFKKGGWSAEEDKLLCEAQKIFGNRWTEIAKVVSGRTDNAVKNRFTTLCKKKAKREAQSKENTSNCLNENNKRIILPNDTSPFKRIRTHISGFEEIRTRSVMDIVKTNIHDVNTRKKGRSRGDLGSISQQVRSPLAALVPNYNSIVDLSTECLNNDESKLATKDGSGDKKVQETFLAKNDPRITALLQQAELLSSLALKVNTQGSNQSFENAWKELQEFLAQSGDSDILRHKVAGLDPLFEDFKNLITDLKSSQTGSPFPLRQSELYEDLSANSGDSAISNPQSNAEITKIDQRQTEECVAFNKEENTDDCIGEKNEEEIQGIEDGYSTEGLLSSCIQPNEDGKFSCFSVNVEFSSPLRMIPFFRSFADGIPSPQFSDSFILLFDV
ncbi:hypothetical protein AMTR_s00010p00252990 [Amborella trichopoda]|uniref:Uncharacterized protein n=1 Tax=Amborella trichopoda TaxID=13333 RepID=W1NGQ7_AMBTC|nr:hypothetical protein AMTR_s00010p00252990 [Amborella trichopoda]